jgi:hypothetical protein
LPTRQGDWESVIAQIRGELSALVARHRAETDGSE